MTTPQSIISDLLAAHTPGPWTVECCPNYQGIPGLFSATIYGRDGRTLVAEIRGAVEIDGTRHTENDANARFIAAAPTVVRDLLAALQTIADCPVDEFKTREDAILALIGIVTLAQEAIDEAKGATNV